MNKFIIWLQHHQYQIGWFLIGWLTLAGIHAIQSGDGISALIDFALAYLNYRLIER